MIWGVPPSLGPQINENSEWPNIPVGGFLVDDHEAHTVQFGVWGNFPQNIVLTLGDVSLVVTGGNTTIQYTVPAGNADVTVTGSAVQNGGGNSGSTSATIACAEGISREGPWGVDLDNLQVGQMYSLTMNIQGINPDNVQITVTGAEYTASCTNNWTTGGGWTITIKPTNENTPVVISISRAQQRTLSFKAPMFRTAAVAPSSITVNLLHENADTSLTISGKDDYPEFTADNLVDTKALTANNNWHYEWEGLPSRDPETGAKYHYYVVEEIPENTKTVTYSRTESEANGSTTVIINNEPVVNPKYGRITVTKRVLEKGTDTTLDISREFTIRLKQGDKFLQYTNESTYRWVDEENSATTWTFNNGGSVIFTGLDLGTYTVVEDTGTNMIEIGGYQFDSDDSITSVSVTLSDDKLEESAEIKNHYELSSVLIDIVKVDSTNRTKKLTGAKFQMTRSDGSKYVVFENEAFEIDQHTQKHTGPFTITEEKGITINDLSPGTYEVKELEPPEGYVVSSNTFHFTIENDGTVSYTEGDNSLVSFKLNSDETNAEFEVGNPPGTALPQTGGIGTTLFTALGGLMTATAGAILTIRRKRKPAEG